MATISNLQLGVTLLSSMILQELGSTKTYERTSDDEKSIVDNHCYHITTKFAVSIKENKKQLPTLYRLPKLHKRPYKARFVANSSSCTTTELSKLLTSCLTAVKNHLIKYCEIVYERDSINLFWSIKNSNEVRNKNLILRALRPPHCLLLISAHFILRYHIILLKINLLT